MRDAQGLLGDGLYPDPKAGAWHAAARAAAPHVELPPDFVPLFEPIAGCDARTLGYVGDARFVLFRYEPRVEEVVWDDGHTYGFGAGGWRDFLDRIAPLADRYAARLCLGGGSSTEGVGRDGGGTDRAGSIRACQGADVLVLDRQTGSGYFASRDNAERFLARLAGDDHAPPGRRDDGTQPS